MTEYKKKVEIRWSDLDPNFHLRHSVYYDWGAFVRMSFLTEHHLTAAVMVENNIGPILLREEAVFRKEIHFGDSIEINVKILKLATDIRRWTMVHEIWKNGNTLAAIITIDGAWIDTKKRKLAAPPEHFKQCFNSIPKAENFEWIIK
ncbi:MAG: thioesterase family protein [Bacteroidota bacterium]|nr:thioesterase family protein [Bacteroidota bacterium]